MSTKRNPAPSLFSLCFSVNLKPPAFTSDAGVARSRKGEKENKKWLHYAPMYVGVWCMQEMVVCCFLFAPPNRKTPHFVSRQKPALN